MLKYFLIFIFFVFISNSKAEIKEKIIENFKKVENLKFKFEQNINGKIESGICTIKYPKKIYCKYFKNKKILVSNGKSLVIKTETSFYRYSLNKTPLNLILDKNFLIKKIRVLNENVLDDNLVNFTIIDDDNEINVFFDNNTFNLIGWKTRDIYQNINITYLTSIETNKEITKNLFKIPN